MTGLVLALLLAATPPRYGGALEVVVPGEVAAPNPAQARTPAALTLARAGCLPWLTVGPGGALQPGLIDLPEPSGLAIALHLRSDLRGAGGKAVRGSALVAKLGALAAPGNPYRALTLPLRGPLSVSSDGALRGGLAFAYPDWPQALTQAATCLAGTGAFTSPARSGRAKANLACPAGRPFADTLALRTATARNAARALSRGEAQVALMALPRTGAAVTAPRAVATYLAVNPRRTQLAGVAPWVASHLDRAELVRIFVPGPAEPLRGLLAPSIDPHPESPMPITASLPPIPAHLTLELLAPAGDARVAERLQVKLHDLGIAVKVTALPQATLERRVGAGDYDAALVAIPALPEPGLALAQVLLLAQPADEVRAELAQIGAGPDPAARRARALSLSRALAPTLSVVPLYAQGLALTVTPQVHGLRFDGSGALLLGDLWLEPGPGASAP